MAATHNWTADQTRSQPRLFIQELLARHEAEAKYHKQNERKGSSGGNVEDDSFPV